MSKTKKNAASIKERMMQRREQQLISALAAADEKAARLEEELLRVKNAYQGAVAELAEQRKAHAETAKELTRSKQLADASMRDASEQESIVDAIREMFDYGDPLLLGKARDNNDALKQGVNNAIRKARDGEAAAKLAADCRRVFDTGPLAQQATVIQQLRTFTTGEGPQ